MTHICRIYDTSCVISRYGLCRLNHKVWNKSTRIYKKVNQNIQKSKPIKKLKHDILRQRHTFIHQTLSQPTHRPMGPVALALASCDHCWLSRALKERLYNRSIAELKRGAGFFLPKVVLTHRQYVLSYYLTEDERLDYDNYSYTATSKPAERKNDYESKYAFWQGWQCET